MWLALHMQDSSVVVDSILRSPFFHHEVDSVCDFDICDGVPGCGLEMASGYNLYGLLRKFSNRIKFGNKTTCVMCQVSY